MKVKAHRAIGLPEGVRKRDRVTIEIALGAKSETHRADPERV